MKLRILSVSLLALALAGCGTVGPDYHMPDSAAARQAEASGPFAGQGEAAYEPAPLPDKWWKLYQDRVLDGLVEKALAHNTDLRVAQANLEYAQAAVQDAQSWQKPSIGVSASPTFGHVSGLQELQPKAGPPDQWSYSGGVSIAYQLDLFGQIRRAVEASRSDEQAAQAAYDAVRVTVVAETARAYADMCSAGMELASAQKSVAIQSDSLDAVRRLERAGRGAALDVTRAGSQLELLKAALPPFKARQRTALYRLAALTGVVPAAMPPSLLECAAPPRLTQIIPVGDGAALLRRRPDIRQAERRLAADTARIGVAMGDLYPKISLGLSGASAGPFNLAGGPGTFSWSLGPLISWTLPNSGAAQARIAQAKAGAKADLARFDASVLNALRETESALVVYARELDRQTALEAARDRGIEAVAQARRLFMSGKTDYLAVLDAQRTLAGTESAVAASQAQLSDDQVNLFLALGGGWQ